MPNSKLTITEALQEIKTINKRLEKKRQAVMQYVARDVRIKDPLESTGGSVKFIVEERQAIGDLEQRIVTIRTEIQRSNLTASLSINGKTRTVSEWLTWRREVSEQSKNFLQSILLGIQKLRAEAQKQGGRVVGHQVAQVNIEQTAPPEVSVQVDEASILKQQEEYETVLGELDGKLSLFNATTVIEF
jgi:hypothetical protein